MADRNDLDNQIYRTFIGCGVAGEQTPRGWGLFLIQNMVDDMRILSDDHSHTIELIFHLEGGSHVRQNA